MPILTITVENASELLNSSFLDTGALGRVERSATGGGAGFSEISTFPLVAGTRTYTVYDLAGAVSSWYRVRFSKAGGTSPTPYGDEFQAGDETAGLICSVYDVWQRMNGAAAMSDNDHEILLEVIRGVTSEVEEFTGAWWVPRPTDPDSTTTLRFDVERYTTCLWLQHSGRYVGIRSISSINLATRSQPESGGTFTAGTVADFFIRPQPSADGPGWRIELSDWPTGGYRYFYPGHNTVEITGSFGPAAVPYWMQEIGIAASTRRFLGKQTSATGISLGPEGGIRLLADLPADMARRLDAHRFAAVA